MRHRTEDLPFALDTLDRPEAHAGFRHQFLPHEPPLVHAPAFLLIQPSTADHTGVR